MSKCLLRRASRIPRIETLEERALLSSGTVGHGEHLHNSANVAIVHPVTKTTLAVQSGSMGQAITFTVNVRDAASLVLQRGRSISLSTVP